jgi:hypothetical protein
MVSPAMGSSTLFLRKREQNCSLSKEFPFWIYLQKCHGNDTDCTQLFDQDAVI